MFRSKEFHPVVVWVHKIWDHGQHNAFTDLIYHRHHWVCVFREAVSHGSEDIGAIRVIASTDAIGWESLALLEIEGEDLRDPKLSVTPDGKLMLVVGSVITDTEKEYVSMLSKVSFSEDGITWGPFKPVLPTHEWLWRVTWYQGVAYGVSYRQHEMLNWRTILWESLDGLIWRPVIPLDIPGKPSEATLRFDTTGQMYALVRRSDKLGPKMDNMAWVGRSVAPYTDWVWAETNIAFGGPNFLLSPQNKWIGAGRTIHLTPYGLMLKTTLVELSQEGLDPILYLPSGGDTSYPGMVFHDKFLWVSYYSSHEEKTAVYLAKVLIE
jgi:hypothetical protein